MLVMLFIEYLVTFAEGKLKNKQTSELAWLSRCKPNTFKNSTTSLFLKWQATKQH